MSRATNMTDRIRENLLKETLTPLIDVVLRAASRRGGACEWFGIPRSLGARGLLPHPFAGMRRRIRAARTWWRRRGPRYTNRRGTDFPDAPDAASSPSRIPR